MLLISVFLSVLSLLVFLLNPATAVRIFILQMIVFCLCNLKLRLLLQFAAWIVVSRLLAYWPVVTNQQ